MLVQGVPGVFIRSSAVEAAAAAVAVAVAVAIPVAVAIAAIVAVSSCNSVRKGNMLDISCM